MRLPRLTNQDDDSQYQPVLAVSPETERVLQALEKGQRSRILPMPPQSRHPEWEPRESA